jgi:hypothetical protein
MVSEEKVILMTRLAAFEKNEGSRDMNIVNYYRSDYIGFQVLKAIIAATLSYGAVLAVYFFYNFEKLMADIYKMDLMEFGKKLITIYLVTVGIYTLLAYVFNAMKYSRAKKRLKGYYMDLRKLEGMNKQ